MAKSADIHIHIHGTEGRAYSPEHLANRLAFALARDLPEAREPRPFTVQQRGAGVNLSIDLIVNGHRTNVPLPFNHGPGARTDYFRVGGHEYGVRVKAHMPYVCDADIEYRGKV